MVDVSYIAIRCDARRGRRTTDRLAFTLIELLVVIAIMGVLSAIALPRYANAVTRYRVEMAVKRVAADLELAAAQARQMSKPVVVSFNTASSSYILGGVEPLSHRAGDYTVDLAAEPYRSAIGSVSFAGASQVIFNMYGRPNSGGQVIVRCGGYSRTAVLDADTGKASVQ